MGACDAFCDFLSFLYCYVFAEHVNEENGQLHEPGAKILTAPPLMAAPLKTQISSRSSQITHCSLQNKKKVALYFNFS